MTEQSPDSERPTWREQTAPQPLPRRKPPALADSAQDSGGSSLFERPQRSVPSADGLSEPPLPQRGAEPLPQRGAEPLPQRGAEPLPQRDGNGALPRRTGRTRPAGRHRSPHRLSVASDAPALVIAVPGAASDEAIRLAEEVASTAETSCPGIEIRLGFLDGAEHRLDDNLIFDSDPAPDHPLDGVLVPLLAGPHPLSDAALARAASGASGQVMLGAHLGPHPLIAEALHARLAEAGLARGTRSRGLSIASSTYGVLVLADRGEDAVKTAGVAAVLLASRLAMPAAPASIDDPAGIDAALTRLREAGAERPVIAPCVIGPETLVPDLEALSGAIGAPYAPPLGAHPAVGQLVAIRYGAALTRLSRVG